MNENNWANKLIKTCPKKIKMDNKSWDISARNSVTRKIGAVIDNYLMCIICIFVFFLLYFVSAKIDWLEN